MEIYYWVNLIILKSIYIEKVNNNYLGMALMMGGVSQQK